MGPKDETSAKPAEIANALVEALGFEPADGKDSGSGTATEVSEQISDVGFAVTDVFDDVAGDEVGDEPDSSVDDQSSPATASVATDTHVDGADAASVDTDDVSNDSPAGAEAKTISSSRSSRRTRRSKRRRSDASWRLNGGVASDASTNGDLAEGSTADDLKAEADADRSADPGLEGDGEQTDAAVVAEGPELADAAAMADATELDPNDTVVMPGPPTEEAAQGKAGRSKTEGGAKDTDELIESLVAAGTMAGAVAPIEPPIADVETEAQVGRNDTGNGVEAKVDPKAPTSPAVTGEHAAVEVAQPAFEEGTVLVDARGVIDKPKSVSDMFSGGITGRRRLQARKVRRVIRHVDPWSVLTFSVLFHLCLFAALLLASVLVWNVADEAGTIENVESFIRELGDYETFEIDGEAIFRAAVAIAGIMTLAASVLVVLLTVMFNLLSDLLGGVRVTVIEEETVRVKPRKQES